MFEYLALMKTQMYHFGVCTDTKRNGYVNDCKRCAKAKWQAQSVKRTLCKFFLEGKCTTTMHL